MALGEHNMHIVIALGIIALFGIITFALTAATLGTLHKEADALHLRIINLDNKFSTTTAATATATMSPAKNASETTTTMPSVSTTTTASETTTTSQTTTTPATTTTSGNTTTAIP